MFIPHSYFLVMIATLALSLTQAEANLQYPSANLDSLGVVFSGKEEEKVSASRHGSDGFTCNVFITEPEVLYLHVTNLSVTNCAVIGQVLVETPS